jgi:hypothetical protein
MNKELETRRKKLVYFLEEELHKIDLGLDDVSWVDEDEKSFLIINIKPRVKLIEYSLFTVEFNYTNPVSMSFKITMLDIMMNDISVGEYEAFFLGDTINMIAKLIAVHIKRMVIYV